jgi:hypothetical protein
MINGRPPAGMLCAAGRGLLLGFAGALVVGAVALFLLEVGTVAAPTQPLRRPVAVANVFASGSSGLCVPRTKTLNVAMVVNKFDPTAQTAAVDVYICAQERPLLELERTTHTDCAGHPESKIQFRYEAELPNGAHEREAVLSTGLCSLIEGAGTGREVASGCPGPGSCVGEATVARLGEFVLPLAGAQQRYPFDWYSGRLTVAVRAEYPTKHVSAGQLESVEAFDPQPFELELVNSKRVAPFVQSATADKRTTMPVTAARIGLQWQREDVTRFYVVIIALVPLILGLLFLVVLFSSHLSGRRAIGTEAIAGIATVLLGILPIRLVLVPAEISSLTLLDYWLGLEIALLAAVPCFAVWRALGMQERHTAASTGHEDEV